MSQNVVSLALSAEQVEAVNKALDVLEKNLSGLISLSVEERSELRKMGPKSAMLARKAYDVMVQSPEILPGSFELAEFTALRSSYAKECYRRLKQYRQTGVWKVSLEDFRRLLDVPKSYRPSEINKYVLKPIEEELGPLLNLKVHRKYLKKKPGRGRASLVGFEFEFDPEKVPGGAPAPRVELSGSVVTDEARKSLRDVSKTPVPDLSVPGEGPALDPDTQAFLDAHGGHGFAGAEGYVSDWPSAA